MNGNFGEIENDMNRMRATKNLDPSFYFYRLYLFYEDNLDKFLKITKLKDVGFTPEDARNWVRGATIEGVEKALYNPIGLQAIFESIHFYGLDPKAALRSMSTDGHIVGVKWMNVSIPFTNVTGWKICGLTSKIAFNDKPAPHAEFLSIEVLVEDMKADDINDILSISNSISVDRTQRSVVKGYRVKTQADMVATVVGTIRTILQYLDGRITMCSITDDYNRNVMELAIETKNFREKMDTWAEGNPGSIYPARDYWDGLTLTHGYAAQLSITPPEFDTVKLTERKFNSTGINRKFKEASKSNVLEEVGI